MGLRERLDALSRGELAGLIVVVALTLTGVGLWYTRSLPKPVAVAATPAPFAVATSGSTGTQVVASSASSGASPSVSVLIVDVTGRVRHPGVYRFKAGDRVIDAIRRAGGPRAGADLTALNLAAPLTDGTQILVPKEGQTIPSAEGAGGTVPGSAGGGAPININTATEAELETLSGVGPVTAAAIIQYRTDHGPFATVDDLLDVSGIGPVTLEELRPQVTV
jgi:competence protein ComEA